MKGVWFKPIWMIVVCGVLAASAESDELWQYSFISIPHSALSEFSGIVAGWSDMSEQFGSIGMNWQPTSNLNLEGVVFPYHKAKNLSHYQMINAGYTPTSAEEKALPVRVNLGMHRLINMNKSILRWFHFGIYYMFSNNHFQWSAQWLNLSSYDDSIRVIGISLMKEISPKIIPAIGFMFNPEDKDFRIQFNLAIHP